MDDLISRLSDLRSRFNCFDANEQDAYHTLSEAIGALRQKKGDTIYRADAIDALEREKTYSTAYKDGYTQTDIFKR